VKGDKMSDFIPLGVVLETIENFTWSDALYLPKNEEWNKTTKGLIWDPNDVEDDEMDAPAPAIENGLVDALDIQTIQGIVYNAKEQKEKITVDELVEAYLFYFNNDAFIELIE